MLRLKDGIDTLRYWNAVSRTVSAHETKVDQAKALDDLRRQRPDMDNILAAIERDGVVAIANYWPTEKCAAAQADVERLLLEYPDVVQRFSANSDKRMFGGEAKSAVIAEFHSDSFLRRIGEYMGGFGLYNFSTLAARIDATAENNGSGDGWHRDAHGFQFKSILYLSDVGDSNGPFEYVDGSHKWWRASLEAALGGLPPAPNTRYDAAAVRRVIKSFGLKARSVVGKAGTLLLANTSGLHRGRPLQSGTRYALTNYFYYPYQIDENKIATFPPMIPGAADRVRRDLLAN